jgi:hypothetical protein
VFGIDAHQPHDFISLGSQDRQSLFDRLDQLDKFFEVPVVSCFGFHFLPQVFDRIVVWRVGRQLINDQSVFVLFDEVAGGFAGVIPGTILDQDDEARELREQILKKGLVAVAVEPFFDPFVNQLAAEELHGAKDLVTFTQSSGFDLGLLADRRPGVG